ncbi:hypothetical protein CBS101457_004826 [Exobasidium rhododendri]|nr:hypothetical protein CBS101457_004826 [Exobasidium rhododendri]
MSAAGSSNGERAPLLLRNAPSTADLNVPYRPRILAMALLFLLSTGANWAEACLGPMKTTLLLEMNINNTQYGIISASTQLANTILPIFAGLWIDRLGASRMAVVATLTVCIGAVLAAVASSTASYPTLVLGRIVQGMGIIVVDTAATKLVVRWSRGAGRLGLAISCNFAFNRAASAISKATAVPIAQSGGQTKSSTTFWVAAIISSLSLFASLFYYWFEQRYSVKPHSSTFPASVSTFAMLKKTLLTLPLFYVYISATQFYQPIAVFNNLSADIIRWKGLSLRASGYLASIGQVAPILVAPLLGGFFDRFGHRMDFIPVTALLLATSIGLLAWTNINPLLAMVIFSLGNALNTPPYLCSLAILLKDDAAFGCSWSIWKVLMQSNQIIMNTTLGRLQDNTPGRGYSRVLLVLFVSKAIEFLWGLSYVALDRIWALGILSADEKGRKAIEASQADDLNDTATDTPQFKSCGLRPNGYSTCIATAYLGMVIILAWTLFFASYLGP